MELKRQTLFQTRSVRSELLLLSARLQISGSSLCLSLSFSSSKPLQRGVNIECHKSHTIATSSSSNTGSMANASRRMARTPNCQMIICNVLKFILLLTQTRHGRTGRQPGPSERTFRAGRKWRVKSAPSGAAAASGCIRARAQQQKRPVASIRPMSDV